MTKKEIVKQISDDTGLTQLKTKEVVQKTFDAIVETLVEERRIELGAPNLRDQLAVAPQSARSVGVERPDLGDVGAAVQQRGNRGPREERHPASGVSAPRQTRL